MPLKNNILKIIKIKTTINVHVMTREKYKKEMSTKNR